MPDITTTTKQMMRPEFRIPSITGYNRLEPQPRAADFDQNLAAAVYDPLWMLTRQWQFGEFTGEDAGSPISARILGEHTPMVTVQQGKGGVQPYDMTMPLETMVEAELIPDSLDLAMQVARYFIRLTRNKALPDAVIKAMMTKFPLNYIVNTKDNDGLQLMNAIQSRLFDGCAVRKAILASTAGGNQFSDWVSGEPAISAPDKPILIALAGDLISWYNRNYSRQAGNQPNQAWQPSQLEYAFDLASAPVNPAQTILSADQFSGGHLEWYSFDLGSASPQNAGAVPGNTAATEENLVSFIPSPVKFKGMPNPRFWMMEDNQTDFGKIDTTTTGLLHLLLAEFGLIYGNDWFMLPYPQPINTLCSIKGLIVTDVFGEQIYVDAAGAGNDNSWQNWAMFHQTDTNNAASPNKAFYLAPVVDSTLDDDPIEEVNFLRDEVASMAWGVETRVPSQSGKGIPGNELGLKNVQPPPPVDNNAAIQYVLGTLVPDNWIPFIPLHIEGSITEIRFQRARMPGSQGPFGVLLKEKSPPYFINEEEIPRAGVLIQRKYRRCRWLDGSTFLWIGREKITGTGEGWSHLQFDQIVNVAPKK